MRFYFHVRSQDGHDIDEEGIDLPSIDAARDEARKAAREMVAELVLQAESIDGMRFEIADQNGAVLATIAFREVIDLN
jgi:hypothetical protein